MIRRWSIAGRAAAASVNPTRAKQSTCVKSTEMRASRLHQRSIHLESFVLATITSANIPISATHSRPLINPGNRLSYQKNNRFCSPNSRQICLFSRDIFSTFTVFLTRRFFRLRQFIVRDMFRHCDGPQQANVFCKAKRQHDRLFYDFQKSRTYSATVECQSDEVSISSPDSISFSKPKIQNILRTGVSTGEAAQTGTTGDEGRRESGFFFNDQGIRIQVYRWRATNVQPNVTNLNFQENIANADTDSCSEAVVPGFLKTTNRKSEVRVIVLVHGYGMHCTGHFFSKPPPESYILPKDELKCIKPSRDEGELHTVDAKYSLICGNSDRETSFFAKFDDSWPDRFCFEGFDVIGLDLQGHGRSGGYLGIRGIVKCLDDYARDVLQLFHLIQKAYPDCRNMEIFVIGISMGGWVALRAAQLAAASNGLQASEGLCNIHSDPSGFGCPLRNENHDIFDKEGVIVSPDSTHKNIVGNEQCAPSLSSQMEVSENHSESDVNGESSHKSRNPAQICFRGVILLSPMLYIDELTRKRSIVWLRHAATILSKLHPTAVLKPFGMSRMKHRHMVDYYLADPLTHKKGIYAGFAAPLINGIGAATSESALSSLTDSVVKSLLIVHHVNDNHCGVEGSISCLKNLTKVRDRHLILTYRKEKNNLPNVQNSLEGCEQFRVSHIENIDIWHSLANEPGERKIFEQVYEWIRRRV